LSSSSTGLIGRIDGDGSLRQASEVNSYRSEVAHHIDVQPRTRPLLSMLYQLLDFGTAVLAILLHRHGLLLCQIAQITSGIPHLLHRLLCRVFHLTGCLCNPISYLLGTLLDVFRCWERATQLLPAFVQKALRLFPRIRRTTEPVTAPAPTPMRSPLTTRFMLPSPFCAFALECDLSSQHCCCSTSDEDMSLLILGTRSNTAPRFNHACR